MSAFIENRTYDEIQIGESATLTRSIRREDVQLFATLSGDFNPAHLDDEYAKAGMFGEVIAHGMLGGALISTVLGTQLPGLGTIYVDQQLRFTRPVKLGDALTVTLTVKEKSDEKKRVILDCLVANQDGKAVIRGVAEVIAPSEKIRQPRPSLPAVSVAGVPFSPAM